MRRRTVVLPLPLGPSKAISSPSVDREADVLDGRHLSEMLADVF
jgi:hypothetical protein